MQPQAQQVQRPITIVIAAIGGEGGGVLTDWLLEVARHEGYRIQSTSIPGVAQRTGATNYYLEIAPKNRPDMALALTPMPTRVDLVIASELIEATRAVQNGYVTPDRTTLIASTHRVYATSEKAHGADGRFDTQGALKAMTTLALRTVLFDMDRATQQSSSVISAVLLGAVAGSGTLPFSRSSFEQVIRESGIAVASNLAGFGLAFGLASGETPLASLRPASPIRRSTRPSAAQLMSQARGNFPQESQYFIDEGIKRLVDYQDTTYAQQFLTRLQPIAALDRRLNGQTLGFRLLNETARHLALRMSFEDLLRVADLKTRETRFERVRREVNAKSGQPVVITEYFKPGIDELSGVLPPVLAQKLLAWAHGKGHGQNLNVGLHIKTSTISGFLLLWLAARLRRFRRSGYRYQQEQLNIEHWLVLVSRSAEIAYEFGLEVAECAKLIRGYSETYQEGLENYKRIVAQVIEPALAAGIDARYATRAARQKVQASIPDGHGASAEQSALDPGFKPIVLTRRKSVAS